MIKSAFPGWVIPGAGPGVSGGYLFKFIKGDFSVEIGVRLNDRSVNKLLQLELLQIVPDHHLQHLQHQNTKTLARGGGGLLP